ncbi:hypothetical protein T07_13728 [Trichinella nelsoni]|uniref:PiggyBac transposable element-derived protein domain-containing protein n=1 Tax=Trichinella nelsoni TaxID=6336 RepID=A0A0V0S2X0_9BILA|nr:hypothetical protein T07_13728 [Trichinella nelsoni]
MISYVPRKNSNVLLLTSRHTKLKVDNQQDDKRPNIMNDYNLGKRGVDSMDARIEDFCCITKTNRHTMLMLYFIVEVRINNAFLLMRHKKSYQKTKKRFMRELLAGQTYRNEVSKSKKSMHKLNIPSSATEYSKIINVTDISYKTIKSIKMPSARTSKINVKLLPFM